MKVDCSSVLNYAQEFNRMCKSVGCKCNNCPMYAIVGRCDTVGGITQTHIDIVQKWSDEHPQETMLEHFLKLFPNAPQDDDETPMHTCPYHLGWEKLCPRDNQFVYECKECWSRTYVEVEK